jgi:phenylacetate-CoA ligase
MAMETEYWDPQKETMPLEKLKEIQLRKIQELVNYAYLHSPFYHKRFDEAGVKPEDIKTLEDFRRKVPFFRADDIRVEAERLKDPYAGMLTMPIGKLEVIHSSTGTTGIPKFTGMTLDEGDEYADAMVRYAWMHKHRPGTRVMGTLEPTGIAPFWHWYVGAWGKAHGKLLAYENVRDCVLGIPAGISFFDDAPSRIPAHNTLIVADAYPSIIDQCARKGVEVRDFIRIDYHSQAGDAYTPALRRTYIEKLGAKDFFDIYGVSEPFLFANDCYAHNGGHVWADHFFIELIDPDTGELLQPGERGEVVVTNLFMKAVPWIRYATEDFAWWTEDKCECGRTHPRIRVIDRTVYRVNVKDKTVMPYDVKEIMERHPETADANFNIIRYADVMDTLRLRASYNPMLTKDADELRGRLVKDFKDTLGVDAEIEWVPFDELAKILHKLMRVVDVTKEAK